MNAQRAQARGVHAQYDFEPVRGLPERLPAGETILWQGAPRVVSLARHGLHFGALAFYFAALLVWCGSRQAAGGAPTLAVAVLLAKLGALALLALGLVAVFSWLSARTTLYTITNRRVVLRFGIAFQLSLNLPFSAIESADIRRFADGTGNLALALSGSCGMGYIILWPHVRPWRLAKAQPMMRSVPEIDRVAQTLGRALAASAAQPAPRLAATSADAQAHAGLPGSAVAA